MRSTVNLDRISGLARQLGAITNKHLPVSSLSCALLGVAKQFAAI